MLSIDTLPEKYTDITADKRWKYAMKSIYKAQVTYHWMLPHKVHNQMMHAIHGNGSGSSCQVPASSATAWPTVPPFPFESDTELELLRRRVRELEEENKQVKERMAAKAGKHAKGKLFPKWKKDYEERQKGRAWTSEQERASRWSEQMDTWGLTKLASTDPKP